MAIYAQPANSFLNISSITNELESGQTLVFDESAGLFINKKIGVDLTGAVTSARNIGLENAIGIFNNKTYNGTLEFNNILPGPGMDIRLDQNNNIVFSVDSTAATVSVSEDYTIIIDNDGSNPNAVFEIKTVVGISANVIPIHSLPPLSANNLFTGNVSGRGFFKSFETDFSVMGFVKDMIIGVEGTTDQDGVFIIDEVVTTFVSGMLESTIFLTSEFTGDDRWNLGGPKYPSIISQGAVWVPDNNIHNSNGYSSDRLYSLQFWNIDIGPSGYNLQPGMIITVIGSDTGIVDGTYLISEVIPGGEQPLIPWAGIIFDPSTPLPAGIQPGLVFDNDLCTNQLKIIINQSVSPTGFSVNAKGEVAAERVLVSALPTINSELTNKLYVDTSIANAVDEFYEVELSAVNANLNELNIKVEKLRKLMSKPLRYYLNHAKW